MYRVFKTCLAGLAALALSFSGLDAATELFRYQGEQFFDSNGDPLAGGKVYYYEAGTTNLQTTYSDSGGTTPNSNPVVLDAAGRLTVPIYFGDSDSFEDYKEDLTTSTDVAVSPWPFDDIPAATPAASAAAFAPPLLSWTQVTSAASPVALTAGNAGNAYEADTTSGSIEFDLPSAASVGDGKGFVFKKMIAANSMVIDQSGSETIDDSATALTVTRQYQVVGIFSNGAEWYKAFEYLDDITASRLSSTFISGLTEDTAPDDDDEFLMQLAGGGAFRKLTRDSLLNPTFVEAGALSSQAPLDITLGTADMYEIDLINVEPVSDGAVPHIRFSQSSTFLFGASDYRWGFTDDASLADDADSEIQVGNDTGNVAGEGLSLTLRIFRPSAAAFSKTMIFFGYSYDASSSIIKAAVGGGTLIANTDAIDGVRLLFSTGNIDSGHYAVRSYRFQ
jgi:hypothetical protein